MKKMKERRELENDPLYKKPALSTKDDMDEYLKFIKGHEGKELTAYKPIDTEEHYTIGYGHYGADVKEGQTITEEEAEQMLIDDINKRLPKVKAKIKNFDSMPIDVKKNLLGSWFRGSLSGSPTAIRLLNEGKYKEAADEFLDNDEYRTTKLGGVKKRMKATANAIRSLQK